MERYGFRIFISVVLIGLGVLLLLNNLNILPWDIATMEWFWLLVFGGAGAVFTGAYLTNRNNWWAVIPGFTLLGLAVLVSGIIPDQWDELGGSVFLGMIGLSFWVIYFTRRDFWWAIIPGGVLVTLALFISLTTFIQDTGAIAIFFLGLGATFLLVYLLPNPQGRMVWALWPASILGIMGILFTLGMENFGQYLVPIILIVIGGIIVYRTTRPRSEE
jgi:hypothetical protein